KTFAAAQAAIMAEMTPTAIVAGICQAGMGSLPARRIIMTKGLRPGMKERAVTQPALGARLMGITRIQGRTMAAMTGVMRVWASRISVTALPMAAMKEAMRKKAMRKKTSR